jgi:hypothetical protein
MRPLLLTLSFFILLIWVVEYFFYDAGDLIHGLLAVCVLLAIIGIAQGKKLFGRGNW